MYPFQIFSFSTGEILKFRLRSPNSNQFFVMFQSYTHENLVRIQPLVHKILCRQERVMTTPMPTHANTNSCQRQWNLHQKQYVPFPFSEET